MRGKGVLREGVTRYAIPVLCFVAGYVYPLLGFVLWLVFRLKRTVRGYSLYDQRRYPLAGAVVSLVVFAVEYTVQFVGALP